MTDTAADEEFNASLRDIAADFQTNVDIKDRKYHLKTYKQVFVGSEAVDYLLAAGHAQNREDAILLGRSLVSEFHLFEHVLRDHEFKDEHLFYRFVPDGERGGRMKDDVGKFVRWSDFLDPVRSIKGDAANDTDNTVEGGADASESTASSLLPRLVGSDNLETISPKDQHVVSQVWPLDKFNTTLLDNVHPPCWEDPTPHKGDGSYTYDLVVIGGGTGGLITAAGSAGVGARVAMIEENMLGGDW